jgi:Ca2+-binding EF-hand superfamily protein
MKTVSTLTAIGLALGLAAPLASMPTAALADDTMLDANENAMIDQDEWSAFGDNFDQLDADADDFISEEEWASADMPTGGDEPVFGIFDADEDAQIGEDEFFTDESFGELDQDKDGSLDDEEFGALADFGVSEDPNE